MPNNEYVHNEPWGAADFERYYKGNMPFEERHALEKAALDDPFLQDALDGYAFSSNPVAEITALQQQLNGPTTPTIRLAWFRQPHLQQWLRAAVLLLCLGSAAVWWLNSSKTENPIIASNEGSNVTPIIQPLSSNNDTLVTVTSPTTDGSVSTTSVPLFKQPIASIPATVVKSNNRLIQNEVSSAFTADSALNELVLVKKNSDAVLLNASIAKSAPMKEEKIRSPFPVSTIRGQVINQQGIPVANASIKDQVTNQWISTDNSGNFELANNRNTNAVLVDVRAQGYRSLNSNLSNNMSNRIVLEPETVTPAQTVVETAPLSKMKSTNTAQMDSGIEESLPYYFNMNRVALKNVAPFAGWDAYNHFIDSHLPTAKNLGSTATGNVLLSFTLNAMGKAENISIIQSLNKACDNAAIRFIQESPAFKRTKKSGKITSSIKF